ncbi:hypothetical protein PanWU01x14_275170 [Parasponia andersonii]|uniref:Uncharacterized protein n=1 Tax=Parasponia andersonii TaxID=3476 RepID=A0A2P5B3H6_PARAD|nr:hypothetical protein PanWU01x14_275170 [Parasponia andersonii]
MEDFYETRQELMVWMEKLLVTLASLMDSLPPPRRHVNWSNSIGPPLRVTVALEVLGLGSKRNFKTMISCCA